MCVAFKVSKAKMHNIWLPFLNLVQIVGKRCSIASQLLFSLPLAQLVVQDAALQLLQLLDQVQVVVSQTGGLELEVVEALAQLGRHLVSPLGPLDILGAVLGILASIELDCT